MQFKTTISCMFVLLVAFLATIQAAVLPPSNSTMLEPRADRDPIRCGGSFLCKMYFPQNNIQAIKGYIQGIDRDKHFLKDEFIACSNTICARLRKISFPIKGWQIKDLIDILAEFCPKEGNCGSVPICAVTNSPQSACTGHLAIEWSGRTRPECEGLCSRPAYLDSQDIANHDPMSNKDYLKMKEEWHEVYQSDPKKELQDPNSS